MTYMFYSFWRTRPSTKRTTSVGSNMALSWLPFIQRSKVIFWEVCRFRALRLSGDSQSTQLSFRIRYRSTPARLDWRMDRTSSAQRTQCEMGVARWDRTGLRELEHTGGGIPTGRRREGRALVYASSHDGIQRPHAVKHTQVRSGGRDGCVSEGTVKKLDIPILTTA